MTDILPFVITGIVSGSLYGLAGLGLVLTYRTSGVFNLGHGAIAAGGAFLFYTLYESNDLPWPVAVLITLVAFALVVGWVMERITHGLGDVPEAIVIVATVGVLLGAQGLLILKYGDVTRSFPEFLPTSGFTVLGVDVSWSQVISLVVATSAAIGLYVFLRRSRLGVAMRAVVDNPTLVGLAGVRPNGVRLASWAVGSAFAALSGILLGPTLGLNATLLTFLVVQAFGACAIGLFSSLPLTYAGGFVVGISSAIATRYLTSSPWNAIPAAIPFLVLLVVLLAVPISRFPARRGGLRSLLADVKPLSWKTTVPFGVVSVGLLLLVPAFVGTYLPVWIAGLVQALIFVSLALLVWTSGQISLCHVTFVALGATTMSHLTQDAGWPWGLGLLGAGLLTVPLGALVALPAVRLSGVYLALATLGFGILMQNVIYPTGLMFGSGFSLISASRPRLSFFDGTDDRAFYYLVLALVAVSFVVIAMIARTRLGRLLRAMAETPTMLATHGLGVTTTRLVVFGVSAFFAGIAGALQITQFGGATGSSYGALQSLMLLVVLVITGTRLVGGSMAAAAILAVIPAYAANVQATASVNNFSRQLLLFGLIGIAAAIRIAKRTDRPGWRSRLAAVNRRHAEIVRRPTRSSVTKTRVAAREVAG